MYYLPPDLYRSNYQITSLSLVKLLSPGPEAAGRLESLISQ